MLKKLSLIVVIVVLVAGAVFFLKVGSEVGPGLADYSYQIAGTCTLDRASAYQITITCDGINKSIDPEVFQVGWDSQYLVATTHPVTQTDPNNPNCTNCDPDNSVTYWWIEDLANKQAYGPMSQKSFQQQETKLGVPNDIQLISVDEAKTKGTWLYGDGRNQ